ncbi:GIY-YIG nuclease family protein [Terriglobus sp. RCC_193]|uniref:GIY-YIG nuclease family protein n=1 Tax=Terriglobus sp. RCC_193 TaxID=3239218 RepID=UPI003526BBC8
MFREAMSKKAYIYIMASRSRTLYIGMTTELDGRISEHKLGLFAGFSRDYRCTRLVYYEIYDGPMAAITREKQLKGWRREKKLALIESLNPTWLDLAENLGKPVQPYKWKREELIALHEALQRAQQNAGPSTSLRYAQDDDR